MFPFIGLLHRKKIILGYYAVIPQTRLLPNGTTKKISAIQLQITSRIHVQVFTTGRGTSYGLAIVPVKVSMPDLGGQAKTAEVGDTMSS